MFCYKYKKTYIEKTKIKRLEMIIEEIKKYENKDFTMDKILQYENEYYGYLQYQNNNVKDDIYFISDIDGNYTNKNIKLYRIKDGESLNCKIKKQMLEETEIKIGSIVKVLEIIERPKNIMQDGKWTQDYSIMYKHITNIKKINLKD